MKKFAWLFLIPLAGCSQDGANIGAPAVRPIVQETMSAALTTGGSFAASAFNRDFERLTGTRIHRLTDDQIVSSCDDDNTVDECGSFQSGTPNPTMFLRCAIKRRLFCPGPTEVLNLLDGLDDRMSEVNARAIENKRTCLDSVPIDKTSTMTFPNSQTFTHHLQCRDTLGGEGAGQLGFGKKDDVWYFREYTATSTGANGTIFSVTSTDVVNGYIVLGDPQATPTYSMSTMLLRLKADRANKGLEITGGGIGIGFCSFQLKSNESFIYVRAFPDGVGGACSSSSGQPYEICLNASNLTQASSSTSCDTLENSLELTQLGRSGPYTSGSNTFAVPPSSANIPLDTIDNLITTPIGDDVPAF